MLRYLILALCLFGLTSQAQTYPSKVIKITVGFAPGGGSDFVARTLAQDLGSVLGQQVIIDNRVGAGGGVAARTVANAEADGYTLLLGSAANFVINPLLSKNLPYETSDFVAVAPVARFGYALLVRKDLPLRSVNELIAYAKQNPSELTVGSAGNGSNTHIVATSFMSSTGMVMRHIPYKGTAPALGDLIGGTIDVLFDSTPTVYSMINAGSLRALAVTGPEREAVLADLPTLAELGVKNFNASNWFAIFAPKRTPAEVVYKLNAAIQKTLSIPRVKKQFLDSGNQPIPGSSNDLDQLLKLETATYKALFNQAKITLD
jgi:tripartite-type tricarboxylate transporter receptor subunit TctC